MRTLLLLLLLAQSGLFVSAVSEHEIKVCGTCTMVVIGTKELGRYHSKEVENLLCRKIQEQLDESGLERLCRRIFREIADNDLYDEINDTEEYDPDLIKFCRTKLPKKYCPAYMTSK
ncbi:hypothetical protein ANCCAN_20399 [Ancylostoma caninum]|uniref:Saposin B-type domain-containing protein n=1 Tax=Ancylostoma caninum TaxID=29170 RepID=A0A368FRW7_ANCCA|nr:hypothetical protein ANCCAN_20399 [Ancylostoma caninum]